MTAACWESPRAPIADYRWNSNAQGWARYGAKDEKMAPWLEEAERKREQRR